ncbi:MAG: alpha/beta hydrolase [Elusimicrobia bacterium]|nr:alpha/beta hydrolase [Elusimicrobiota bacterium]
MRRLPLLLAPLALAACTSVFFQPTRRFYVAPEEFKLEYETVRFRSQDGTGLTGLYLHASTAPVRGTVIQFHGNGENMTSHYAYAAWLAARGYNVFAFDYRGYGASQGIAGMRGAVEDGMAAVDYVMGRPDVDPARVAVWGQSLGGALAIAALGSRRGPAVRALVLESTFDSYRDMAQDALSRSWLTWPLQWPLSRLLISDRYRPARYVDRLPPCRILVMHSEADQVVPFRLGQRLFSRLPEPKEFWRVERARHLEIFGDYGAVYRPRLTEFLDRAWSGR